MQRLAFLLLAGVISISSCAGADCNPIQWITLLSGTAHTECMKSSGLQTLDLQPTDDTLRKACPSASCRQSFAQLNEAFPTECSFNGVNVRQSFINRFYAVCANYCGSEAKGAQYCPAGKYCQPWNPTFYECRTLDDKCGVQEFGVDYSGDDLATLQLTLPEDCCAKCASTSGCTGYTFVNYNADGKAYCYLKKGPGKKVSKVGAISATIVQEASCGAKAPAKCSRQYINVDFYGNDIGTFNSISNDECCERCAGMTGCKAYTYVAGNVASASACYLKSDASDQRTTLGLLSGLVN